MENDNIDIIKSGYLHKQNKAVFKFWKKRWFYILNGQLVYSKNVSDFDYVVLASDIRLINVRKSDAKCLEIRKVNGEKTFLKAETEEERDEWFAALQQTTEILFHHSDTQRRPTSSASYSEEKIVKTTSTKPRSVSCSDVHSVIKAPAVNTKREEDVLAERQFLKVIGIKGNDFCADCGKANPEWASINLGILVCIDCSGAHRKLGVNISRVKSLKMDTLDAAQWDIIFNLGNSKVNSIYLHEFLPKLIEDSSPEERENLVTKKYVEKAYSIKMKEESFLSLDWDSNILIQENLMKECRLPAVNGGEEDNNQVLENFEWEQATTLNDLENFALRAIVENDLGKMLNVMVQGLDVNQPIFGTPLLNLALGRNMPTMAEFLLFNGAKPSNKDTDGNTALHISSCKDLLSFTYRLLCVSTLTDIEVKNKKNQTVLDVAEAEQNVHLVVLLKNFKLKELMKDSEADEQYNDFINELKSSLLIE